jgi:transposase
MFMEVKAVIINLKMMHLDLCKQGVLVLVVNLLFVKLFIQTKLAKVKTDKSDAKTICEYGQINEVPLNTALTDVQSGYLQLF